MKPTIKSYLDAGFACLYAVSHEEERIMADLRKLAVEMKHELWSWTCTSGLVNTATNKGIEGTAEPAAALKAFCEHFVEAEKKTTQGKHIENRSIVVLRDFHMFLKTGNPILVRRLKEAIAIGRATKRHLIILGCQLHLPAELEKEVTVIEFALPTRDELLVVAKQIAKSAKLELNGETEKILDAGSGLTTGEFADALSLSYVATKDFSPAIISGLKAETIKKGGLLEVVTSAVSLEDIGGLDLLKADLHGKRHSFSQAAKEYGLPSPSPCLCVGQPGTGKSLTAAAAGSVFGVPLLRLEAGRLFGSLVGESERNWRSAFATAKAIAPCVVWVDEVCGLFSGAESSGQCDGGTTSRVIKAILQDLQFNSDGMFFVFTANDIDALPDPLIDRCEVWSVELPTQAEREAIWKIHIAKRKRKPKEYAIKQFAAKSEGFSGRQIEQAWVKAMMLAFNDKGREPINDDVYEVLKSFTPTSTTMREAIERRRVRLKDRAKTASSIQESEAAEMTRQLA